MEVKNPKTNRYVKVGSQGYKRLVREGVIKPVETVEQTTPVFAPQTEPEPEEPEPFDETKLQSTLADISTDMIKNNLKQIVKAQKLSDADMDTMLKKMLYKKLCLEPPKPIKKKKKKPKFKVVSSESESN
jgi:hypothetical protein